MENFQLFPRPATTMCVHALSARGALLHNELASSTGVAYSTKIVDCVEDCSKYCCNNYLKILC